MLSAICLDQCEILSSGNVLIMFALADNLIIVLQVCIPIAVRCMAYCRMARVNKLFHTADPPGEGP